MTATALPNPWLPETADGGARQADVICAPDGSFVLDQEAFMAALLDDRPAFLSSPSAEYLEALL
jgi:hypothetical protein